jgi:hypothetical protein
VKNEKDAEMAYAVASHLVRALADYKDYTGIYPGSYTVLILETRMCRILAHIVWEKNMKREENLTEKEGKIREKMNVKKGKIKTKEVK